MFPALLELVVVVCGVMHNKWRTTSSSKSVSRGEIVSGTDGWGGGKEARKEGSCAHRNIMFVVGFSFQAGTVFWMEIRSK